MPILHDNPMPETAASRLAGERIALAGKLASMSRSDAGRIVAEHGGELQNSPEETTTLLVKGDGALDAELASTLPEAVSQRIVTGQITLIDETQLWRRVGLVDEEVGVSRLYTPAILAEMVKVEPRVIHRWHRRGYLIPACEVRKLPYFDFSELRVARRLTELVHAGVSLAAIDRQMAELTRLARDVARPLADLSIVVEGGKIFLRRGSDLTEPSGQLLIDFDTEPAENREIATPKFEDEAPSPEAASPEVLRIAALDLQDDGKPAEALELWRAVLLAGETTPEDHFLAADLMYQLGDLSGARERYYVAVELDEDYDEARVNLGCVLVELGDVELAAGAFRGALARNADFADAHYHLAHALEGLHQPAKAQEHWQAFLQLAPESPWAEAARERLAATGE
ncbi:MAG: tetratricopeptide repeat protein [Aeoliella sp.]